MKVYYCVFIIINYCYYYFIYYYLLYSETSLQQPQKTPTESSCLVREGPFKFSWRKVTEKISLQDFQIYSQ